MIEFTSTTYGHCDDRVAALVDAMRCNRAAGRGDITFTVLNGIKIVADSKMYEERSEYTTELQWSFGLAFRHPKIAAAILEGKDGCPNLVPELEALTDQLMVEFETIDHHNTPSLLQWFVRLTPTTWLRDALSKRQKRYIITQLDECPEYHGWQYVNPNHTPVDPERRGQHFVKEAIVALQHFCLNEVWLANAKTWLAENQ